MDYLITIYGCMFLVGVLGNGTLCLTLCCGPGAKTRSPLLFGLIFADLLVCCLSGPVTAALYVLSNWTQTWKYIALFIQAWPVSASTLLMMAISVDRYLTIKSYRPAGQIARRRHLLNTAVIITWISAAILSGTQFICKHPWRKSLVITHVLLVYVMPACAVLISHLGVHAKLTAISLTARAKHGELPLPMPLLRRPTHVIIVAGISKHGRDRLQTTETSVENISQPPTSTLRSRRRLANSLLWVAIVFAVCWFPYIVCQFCGELGTSPSTTVQRYSLLLGHTHSAFSPILYWTLNHQWPQRPCRFRLPVLYRSASSTNEAALGPFHPRLVRPPPIRRRSSHYLY
ncbi:somatostatin receptor type 4 [Tribolium madens]|uniref:somatostatin receptor type 4 n=1 Tax=Tribolium madens TaxID=41895 RepID=UPI001CF71F75|nr:somatostatin receptor type 4 [Tribolium madens]